jgi:hypothetical protein
MEEYSIYGNSSSISNSIAKIEEKSITLQQRILNIENLKYIRKIIVDNCYNKFKINIPITNYKFNNDLKKISKQIVQKYSSVDNIVTSKQINNEIIHNMLKKIEENIKKIKKPLQNIDNKFNEDKNSSLLDEELFLDKLNNDNYINFDNSDNINQYQEQEEDINSSLLNNNSSRGVSNGNGNGNIIKKHETYFISFMNSELEYDEYTNYYTKKLVTPWNDISYIELCMVLLDKSDYIVNEYNNNLSINKTKYEFDIGNYDIYSFIDKFEKKLVDYKISICKYTQIVTIIYKKSNNEETKEETKFELDFTSNKSIANLLGFENKKYTGSCSYVGKYKHNFYHPSYINFDISFTSNSTSNSTNEESSVINLIDVIPLDVPNDSTKYHNTKIYKHFNEDQSFNIDKISIRFSNNELPYNFRNRKFLVKLKLKKN